ncbi:zf-DHHC domain containing protein [Asbolus verrucosus]|uniref:Palmitoyltransferase n=1 Tax=Asbolus verrucosus TaxID=1661398 RepID=A0A482VZ12_ASBVE|nr:zf-DHHC domain containing protein [Asbolus verrucosus]
MYKFFLNFIPPICVLILTVWSYYTYIILFCIYFLENVTKKSVYIAVYHILLIMFLWAFIQTMFEQHDPISDEYKLSQDEHDKLMTYNDEDFNLILKKLISLRKLEVFTCSENGKIRYCKECQLIKPDRTHHCSTCKRCILKMDHHCPWVGNCVGFCNYKQFILTLMYSTIWCMFYVGSMAEYVVELWNDIHLETDKLQMGIGFLTATCAVMLVMVLFMYHVGLTCRNETTLEALRDVTFRGDNMTFDLGKWHNFAQVFGENVCWWLIPIRTACGNGNEFSVTNLV